MSETDDRIQRVDQQRADMQRRIRQQRWELKQLNKAIRLANADRDKAWAYRKGLQDQWDPLQKELRELRALRDAIRGVVRDQRSTA